MCNFCECLANLFNCGCNGNTAGAGNCYDDIETTVVCGNCQCGAENSCCDLCNAEQAESNNCGCCNRCRSCGNYNTASANNGCGCGCNG